MQLLTPEQIAKALRADTDLTYGGQLNREQQNKFVDLMITHTTMLAPGSGVQILRKLQKSGDIDKMMLHGTVVQSASENAPSTAAALVSQYDNTYERFQTIPYDCNKVKAATGFTTEFLTENLERGTLEPKLRSRFFGKVGSDLEDLAINGTGAAGLGADADNPRGGLYSIDTGWEVASRNAHISSAGGSFISRAAFEAAFKRLPRDTRRTKGAMKWFFNDDVELDWMSLLSGRMDSVGGQALGGTLVNPLGIPYMVVPYIPSELSISTSSATPALRVGVRNGPFQFDNGVNDVFQLEVDNKNAGAAESIDMGAAAVGLAAGVGKYTRTAAEVSAIINEHLRADAQHGAAYDNVCSVHPTHDLLMLKSPTAGAASEVQIYAAAAINNLAADILGLGAEGAAGVYDQAVAVNGSAAAASNTINEGTFVWLTDPANFLWVVVTAPPGTNSAGIRSFAEFNKDRDRMEMIVYAQVDQLIEDTQQMARISDLRVNNEALA